MTKQLSDEELKKKLTSEQFHLLREGGTEAPFTGKYVNHNEAGMYKCAACGANLFSSDTKFESTAPGLNGWPSFSDVVRSDAIRLTDDNSFGMHRVGISCANCGSQLGHLFENVPGESHDKHYCINSACLDFEAKK